MKVYSRDDMEKYKNNPEKLGNEDDDEEEEEAEDEKSSPRTWYKAENQDLLFSLMCLFYCRERF